MDDPDILKDWLALIFKERWRHYTPLKCWEPLPQWHSITFQKTFILNKVV
jgi:hypothetical protein